MFWPALTSLTFALPCQYTVRDVAFVDLGDPAYQLVCYVDAADDAGRREELSSLFTSVLGDSNVQGRLLDPDEHLERIDAVRLQRHQVQEFPFAALIGPEGRELALPWIGPGDAPGARSSRLLDSIVYSPTRARLGELLVDSFCAVILVEGSDSVENARGRDEIDEAFRRLGGILDQMPKDVGSPPELLVIGAAERELERVFCWSLGLDDVERETPAAAVLLGRGRLAGPLLREATLDRETLFGILATAGLSCECDLDRSWMRGKRVPLRWDEATRKHAADRLGFDPENPRVRSEITSILAHRGPRGGVGAAPASVDELLLAYREEVVLPAETPRTPELAAGPPPPPADPVRSTRGGAALRNLMIAFSVIAGLSVLISITVLLRTRPR